MIKLKPNSGKETKFRIPAFSVTLSQILITFLIVGFTALSLLIYVNTEYLIDVTNSVLAVSLNLIEHILMWLGIGFALIIIWISLIIGFIKSNVARTILKSYKKETFGLIGITFFVWGLGGILLTSQGFPGWSSTSQAVPIGGIIGQSISGYDYGTIQVILRLSGILIISSIIARPTILSILSSAGITGSRLFLSLIHI